MLKELRIHVSRHLSSYTKSRIRTRLYLSGFLTPKPVEKLVIYEPEAMTTENAAEVEARFIAAACRILRLGQDTVAIHSCSKRPV